MPQKRKTKIEDFCSLRQVSGPQVSPDGSKIAFSVTDPLCHENKYVTHLYIADLEGRARQLTASGSDNRNPVWSPSGDKIAFLSDIDGNQSLWAISPENGTLTKIASLGENLSSPLWSPDSKKILFLSRIPQGETSRSDVLIIRTLPYKFDTFGFLNNKWSHLLLVDGNGEEPKQITEGEYSVTAAAWNTDGSKIAYLAAKGERREFSYWNDVWIVDLESGEHRRLTDQDRYFQSLAFSPDGKWLAYVGRKRTYGLATKTDIYVLNLETNNEVNLTAGFNSKIGDTIAGGTSFVVDPSPIWTKDSDGLYFLTAMNGLADLYRVSLESKQVRRSTDGTRTIQSYCFSKDQETLALLATDMLSPSEIWLYERGNTRRLTRFNDRLLEEVQLSGGEKFTFTTSDGIPVDCWFYRPVGFASEMKSPMVLILKGGPHTWCYGNAFSFQAQVLAANGYAVLYTNERGSGGYGEEFAKTARAKFYGEREYQDTMEAVDHAIQNFPVDASRLGITGYSRGGFLTNWAITHTNRFKAAVTAGGISDFYSFYGIGDEMHIWSEENFEGTPWDNEELYLSKSPMRYVKNVTTPTMIIHAQRDYRSSVTQAEELYTSLKRLGKETELIIFPGENHGLPRTSLPQHLMEYHRHVLRWFNQYLQNE